MITKVEDSPVTNTSFAIIPLNHGKFAMVDPELYPVLKRFYWRAVKSKHCWYAVRRVQVGKQTITIKMHREIARTPENMVCHHRHGNSLDNRLSELQNMYYLEHIIHHQIYRYNKCQREILNSRP